MAGVSAPFAAAMSVAYRQLKAARQTVQGLMKSGMPQEAAEEAARAAFPPVSSSEPSGHGVVNPFNRTAMKHKGQLLRVIVQAGSLVPWVQWKWEQRAHDSTPGLPVYGLTFMTAPGQPEGATALRLGDQLVRVNGVSALGDTAEAPQALLDRLFSAAGAPRLELKIFRPSDFQRDNQHAFAQAMTTGKGMVCNLIFIV